MSASRDEKTTQIWLTPEPEGLRGLPIAGNYQDAIA
jgi:hypothetical protein